ncbi:MAG TPA: hypothetical protein VF255_00685 [Solirubrobacterales bacterium]
MLRTIKLAASCAFVVALGALTGTAAVAADFHSEVAHTEYIGEQHASEDTWTFNAGTVRCSHVTWEGTETVATTTTLTLTPTTSGCKAFGFVNTAIDHRCSLTLHTKSGTSTAGTETIECPQYETITAFNCWVTIGPQGPLTGVTYTNQGAGTSRDITIDFNTTGIEYTQHSKSFPGCTNGTFKNGTHQGSLTLKGFNTAHEQVGIWVH